MCLEIPLLVTPCHLLKPAALGGSCASADGAVFHKLLYQCIADVALQHLELRFLSRPETCSHID